MKRNKPTRFSLLLLAVALLLVLVACVRPTPAPEGSDQTPAGDVPTMTPLPPLPTPVTAEPTALPYPVPGEDVTGGEATAVPPPDQDGGVVEQPQATAVPTTAGTPASHTVQAGETLFSIARLYNITPEELAVANNLANVNQLDVGQVLVIPTPGSVAPGATPPPTTGEQVHVVQAGENLFRIALRYGMNVNDLAAYNGIANPNFIYVGQVIRIPPR